MAKPTVCFVNAVQEEQAEEEEWTSSTYMQCAVGGLPCSVIIDTGAGVSIMAKHFMDRLGWDIDKPCKSTIIVATGHRSVPLGEIRDVPVQFGQELIPIRMVVTSTESYNVILGMSWLNKAKAKIDVEAQKLVFLSHRRRFSIPLDIRRKVLPRLVEPSMIRYEEEDEQYFEDGEAYIQ